MAHPQGGQASSFHFLNLKTSFFKALFTFLSGHSYRTSRTPTACTACTPRTGKGKPKAPKKNTFVFPSPKWSPCFKDSSSSSFDICNSAALYLPLGSPVTPMKHRVSVGASGQAPALTHTLLHPQLCCPLSDFSLPSWDRARRLIFQVPLQQG